MNPNQYIVDHLRERFKTRYGIELTRELRLSLIDQIKTKEAECCYKRRGKNGQSNEFWRVHLTLGFERKEFDVIYDRDIEQILTVLPSTDSEEFDDFAKKLYRKYGLTKEQIIFQRKTSKELERESIEKLKLRDEYISKVQLGLKRLKEWKTRLDFTHGM